MGMVACELIAHCSGGRAGSLGVGSRLLALRVSAIRAACSWLACIDLRRRWSERGGAHSSWTVAAAALGCAGGEGLQRGTALFTGVSMRTSKPRRLPVEAGDGSRD